MDLERTYKIDFTFNKGKDLTQYIEADNADQAIRLAKSSFHCNLASCGRRLVSIGFQKACKLSKVNKPLRFGFGNGWTTVRPDGNDTIHTMLKKAMDNKFTEGKPIEEVYSFTEL
jgi:hypothetical protein